MPENAVGVREIDFNLCRNMPFKYVEQVLSYVGKCLRSTQDILYLVSKNVV